MADVTSKADPLNPATDEDWIKRRTWDLGVEDLDGLLDALWVDDQPLRIQQAAVRHFMKLPSAQAMSDDLKTECETFLARRSDGRRR